MKDYISKIVPQGAPRGFLVYWMLHRISAGPTHGYEILREIEQKSEGAWRPGPGSVYPLLRRLVSEGYIQAKTKGGGKAELKEYSITRKGARHLQQTREMFKMVSRRWGSFRNLFVDLVAPADVAHFVVEGSRGQFDTVRRVVEANTRDLSSEELGRILREYSLILDGQRDWAVRLLSELKPPSRIQVAR